MKNRAILITCMLTLASAASAGPGKAEKDVVLKFENEFKNKHNLDIVTSVMSADYVAHGLAPTPVPRDGMKALGASVFAAFPDVQAKIDDVVVDGDRVVTRVTISATHKGPFNGIPATQKKVTWTEMHMYRVKDGRIAEQWSNVDFLGLLTQLGAFPPPPPAAR